MAQGDVAQHVLGDGRHRQQLGQRLGQVVEVVQREWADAEVAELLLLQADLLLGGQGDTAQGQPGLAQVVASLLGCTPCRGH
ncbi:hypothetical protein SDC9_179126 [bioreactor metagenome]|uniref:Uncharacterized protein n=1 Tax=bioreactor metagenome TaxID=1076179 RepID=A0A645H027_9ZZZZ